MSELLLHIMLNENCPNRLWGINIDPIVFLGVLKQSCAKLQTRSSAARDSARACCLADKRKRDE